MEMEKRLVFRSACQVQKSRERDQGVLKFDGRMS
jgi:hypothetical protein